MILDGDLDQLYITMSRPHDGHRAFFPIGNPFKRITTRGSSLSKELLSLLNDFEESLMDRLELLDRKEGSDIISFSWMVSAMESLSETHRDIQTLIIELQFPVSEWDKEWMDIYLDNSVKLLDICNGYSSELAQLDQNQLLLSYILHLLGHSTGTCPSQERLAQANKSFYEWTERNNCKSPRLNNSSSILRDLAGSLYMTKVKNSAKGKVLMRAMYGLKVHTIFICGVFLAMLSGSPQPLMDLPVYEKLAWAEAFNKLQVDVNGEIRRSCSQGRIMAVKELELVDGCVQKLTSLACNEELCDEQKTNSKDAERTTIVFKECVSDLGRNAEKLATGVDNLSKQVRDFFGIILAGRDALLSNLRVSDGKKCTKM